MQTVKVLGKGQVVIPAPIRRKYQIRTGTEIQILEYGGLIYLIPPSENPVNSALGCLPKTPSLSEELLKDRGWDAA
jgi:AbrB family looped-hinge helix DNA binding protein